MKNIFNHFKKIIHFILLLLVSPNKLKMIKNFKYSRSQLYQDLFVLTQLNFKKGGFFVEFGACDGLYLSNSLLLESKFNWKGILSEPCKTWHNSLMNNRRVNIDYRCVWSKSDELISFGEDIDPAFSGLITGLTKKSNDVYNVTTIALDELLIFHKAPDIVDFLSIDTEGTEFNILEKFRFDLFKIKIICVEHNYGNDRKKIHDLLIEKGYIQKFKYLSRFDDWYVFPDSL